MVNYKPSALHNHEYTEPYIFWGSRFWSLGVTWRHRNMTIGHFIRNYSRPLREHFPIGGQWWPWIYLSQIRRYGASKILGSRVWLFGVTWRHRSRNHWTPHMWFPIGGPLKSCICLAPLWRYGASKILGSRPWLLGSRDVVGHVTIGLGVGTFLLVVSDDHAPILHGYGDTGLQRFWGHEFDLLGSCDVIGHVTIGLCICGFLLVVHCNHASILHRYGDMGPKRYWGHDLDFWGHVTSSVTWPSDSA